MTDFKKLLENQRAKKTIGPNGEININDFIVEEDKTMIVCKRGQKPAPKLNAKITIAGADYSVKFGYDRELVAKFKEAVPESERNWHRTRYVWLVHPDEITKAVEVIQAHTGQVITLPTEKPITPETIEKTFLLEYLGATKDRGKRTSAYGSVNGDWASEFPEDVLKDFFEKREHGKSDGLQTLYQVLCVFESATDQEIKSAYRRLARQWHPDVCREDNATEMFRKLDEAYKVLSNPEQKRRYDAGLYFERQGQDQGWATKIMGRPRVGYQYGYRAPLRCGQITARGTVRLMRFVVSEILKWDDVIKDGKVMTSSWPKGSDSFVIEWLNQSQSPF